MRPIVPAILILPALAGPPRGGAVEPRHAAVVERADRLHDVDHDYEGALGTMRGALDADSSSSDQAWLVESIAA